MLGKHILGITKKKLVLTRTIPQFPTTTDMIYEDRPPMSGRQFELSTLKNKNYAFKIVQPRRLCHVMHISYLQNKSVYTFV